MYTVYLFFVYGYDPVASKAVEVILQVKVCANVGWAVVLPTQAIYKNLINIGLSIEKLLIV